MKKTIRSGAALAMALAATGAFAADVSAREAAYGASRAAQPCDTRGYDAEAMQARGSGCAPVAAAPIAPGGYDPIAMYAVHGERSRLGGREALRRHEPDELTLRAWSGP